MAGFATNAQGQKKQQSSSKHNPGYANKGSTHKLSLKLALRRFWKMSWVWGLKPTTDFLANPFGGKRSKTYLENNPAANTDTPSGLSVTPVQVDVSLLNRDHL